MGHSYVRKIVAYTKWPKREAWRRSGRCIERLVRDLGDGWEAWKLNTDLEEIRTRMKMLQRSGSRCVCERCKKPKEEVCGRVCDAGQFHETVSARQAMASLSDQVNRVRNKSDFDSATAFLQKNEEWSSEECQTQVWTHVVFLVGGAHEILRGRHVCFTHRPG